METEEPTLDMPAPQNQDNDIEELDPLMIATTPPLEDQISELKSEEHHEPKQIPLQPAEKEEYPKLMSSPSLLYLALKAAPVEAAFITDDENDEEFGGFEISDKQTPGEAQTLKSLQSELEEAEAAAALEAVSESEESLPGSPGDLVIADSSEEPLSPQESASRRKRAPSIASTTSGGSSASGRNRKFDPTLPIYQQPFQRGFVREVVYRSTYDISKETNHADIYYFVPPNGKKLRSSVDVARYLADNSVPLPAKAFTFVREPLGIADPKKEIIRYAKTKDSPPPPPKIKRPAAPPPVPKAPAVPNVNGGGIRPPKRARKSTYQDPVWITSDPKNKQTPCGIYCAKAAGQVPTLQCSSCVCLYHPVCVGLSQLDSSCLLGYICNNCRQEKSSQKSVKPSVPVKKEVKPEAPPQSLVVVEGRQFVVIPKTAGKVPLGPPPPPAPTPAPPPPAENHEPVSALPEAAKDPTPAKIVAQVPREKKPLPKQTDFLNNLNTEVKILLRVFSYLSVKELLRASQVCTSWRLIADSRSLWRIVRLKNSNVSSWSDCTEWLNLHRTEVVDLRKMVIPERNPVGVWTDMTVALGQVRSLKAVELGRCSPAVVSLTATSCSKLTALSAISLTSSDDTLDIASLRGMSELQKLRLRGAYSLNVQNLESLQQLHNLTCLSVTSVKCLPVMSLVVVLTELPKLEVLELGECYEMLQHAEITTESLAKMQCLKRLRLEYLCTQRPHTESDMLVTFFESLTVLPCLEHLELVHIEAPPGCDTHISKLATLRSFLLVPSFIHKGATTSQVLLRGVLQLKNLKKLVIGLTNPICESGHKAYLQKHARSSPQWAPAPKPHDECLPVAIPVPSAKSIHDPKMDSKVFTKKLDSIEVLPGWHLHKLLKEGLPNAEVSVRLLPHPNRFTLDEWLLL